MRSSDAKRLIVINTIRTIIEIFLGPFLTAYFFKLNSNNVTIISVYYIFSYLVIALLSFIVGIVLKKHYELPVFKLGIMAKFIQLLILVFLGDNVKKHIWILAIISGISTITWAFPFNLFSSSLVDNKEKKEFVVYRNIGANIVKVIVPVLFGALISTKSFEMTALIVLGLSFVQLLLSLKLTVKKEEKKKESKLNLYENYLLLKQDKNTNNLLKSLFFQGMTFEGSLETTITLLIIIAFNKDFSLGIITSIGSFLSILSAYFCKKIIKPETMKKILLISCIIPLISTLGILFITNKITIIIYNLVYAFFVQIVIVIKDIKTLKLSNSKIINDSNRVEAYVLFEMVLGIGRIVSYSLLLFIGLCNKLFLLKGLIIILTISILLLGRNLLKIDVN